MSILIKERLWEAEYYDILEIDLILPKVDSLIGCLVFQLNNEDNLISLKKLKICVDLIIIDNDNKITKILESYTPESSNDFIVDVGSYLIIFPSGTAEYFNINDNVKIIKNMDITTWENILLVWIRNDIDFVANHLNKGDTYIDIGANTGILTKKILDKIGYNFLEKAILFEPIKKYYDECLNKFTNYKNIEIYQLGLSDTKDDKIIYAATSNLGYNKIYRENMDIKPHEKISIKTDIFSDWIKSKRLEKVDFIKIDAEGHDTNILRGMIDWLDEIKHRPKILFETYWYPEEENELIDIFRDRFGYKIYPDVLYKNTFMAP